MYYKNIYKKRTSVEIKNQMNMRIPIDDEA